MSLIKDKKLHNFSKSSKIQDEIVIIDLILNKGSVILKFNDGQTRFKVIEINKPQVLNFSSGLFSWKGAYLEIESESKFDLTIGYLINDNPKTKEDWFS